MPVKRADWVQISVGFALEGGLAAHIPTALLSNQGQTWNVAELFWGKYDCKQRNLRFSCCSGEEVGGCFMAVTLGLAGRDFSSSAAMLSIVLEQGFNIKYREQARDHLVLETWFTPSSGSSSQCSTENSSCCLPREMWNWGHLCSSKKCFSFWWERSTRVLEQQNQVLQIWGWAGSDSMGPVLWMARTGFIF